MYNEKEKSVIRELAKRLAELANQPIMEERRKLWYAHNDLKTDQPVIDCSPEGAWREAIPPETLVCEDGHSVPGFSVRNRLTMMFRRKPVGTA